MNAEGVELVLWKEWAIDRQDIYPGLVMGPLHVLDAALPMYPDRVMKALGVTADQLLRLVATRIIGRPGKMGEGKVAWRQDEVDPIRGRVRVMVEDRVF